MKKILKKIIFREKSSSKAYISYLKKRGVTIGNECIFFSPRETLIDVQYPWMIKIGDRVRVCKGVIILTHDYSWSVLRNININNEVGRIIGASGTVEIGDNVFIGMNSIILRNVKIGENTIIGAGSVVTKDCKPNSVYAGNPASYVMSIEEFYNKRLEKQMDEAAKLAREYYKKYNIHPSEDVFHEYFFLFCNMSNNKNFNKKLHLENDYFSVDCFKKNKPIFNGFEDFLRFALNEENESLNSK